MKPILFNTEMVKAILDGRKTQTRRVIKPQPYQGTYDARMIGATSPGGKAIAIFHSPTEKGFVSSPRHCPYGQAGDRLWGRETFCEHTTGGVIYRADEKAIEGVYSYHSWKPSIHMPRWASRITLEITEVRVEGLQEISEEDVLKEGLCHGHDEPRIPCFEWLWNSLNAKRGYGWETNPWVWVVSFRRING